MKDAAVNSSRSVWLSLLGRWLMRGVKVAFFLVITLPLTWVCFAGERTLNARYYVCYLETDPTYSEQRWEHGWPLVFLRREIKNDTSEFYRVDEGYRMFESWNLAVDVFVLAVMIGALAYVLVRPRRSASNRGHWSFSLRSALVVITVACIALASYGNAWRQSQREIAVGAQLERLGHSVRYGEFGPRWLTRLFGSESRWVTFRGIDEVRLFEEAGDRDLDVALQSGLRDVAHLKEFYLSETRISDDGLARFLSARRTWRIEQMSVSQTPISGAPFVGCHSLNQLETIWANDSKFDDEAVAAISELPSITFLNVSDCAVTATSLDSAQKMPRLREFICFDTPITTAELDPLRQRGVVCHPANYSQEGDLFGGAFLSENPFGSETVGDNPFANEDNPFAKEDDPFATEEE